MKMRALIPAVVALLAAGCWRIGEPTESAAVVAWAAYPETVVVGEVFSFEFAGPVTPDACGRLDTATVAIQDSVILLAARRSVFETMCGRSPVSFYEARALRLDRPGRYGVRTAAGRDLGTLVAVDSGRFSRMRAIGEGTVTAAGGGLLFGPGRVGNQRPFALRAAPPEVAAAVRTGQRVALRGTLAGFSLCGSFGSRPVIVVDTARVMDLSAEDYY
jgi:hypothetical protein